MAPLSIPTRASILGLLAWAALGCAPLQPVGYTAHQLRLELEQRVPDLRPDEIVVPYDVSQELVERARAALPRAASSEQRVEALVQAMGDPAVFGLRYDWAETVDARSTIENGRGNCLALASVLIGLARGLGMRAYYAEALRSDEDTREVGDVKVWSGHMATLIVGNGFRAFVDFSGSRPEQERYQRIDDVRAVAHYYNNRGYALLHEAHQSGQAIPWGEARRQFQLATQVAPGFASAWNNLGVALSRLGNAEAARRMYRQAVETNPALEAAQANLLIIEERLGE
jgi:tetratricopeptide (TPR) repeat protein